MSSVDKSPTAVRRSSPTPSVTRRPQNARQQSLEFEVPVAANDEPLKSTAIERLWLCIHLPALPLEALSRNKPGEPRAVFDDQDGVRKVLLANREAMSAGVLPGLSVNAALALLPMLELEQRDEPCEQRALLNLAAWAEQFTSFVTVDPVNVLLLELAGSLRLFSGLRSLRRKISDGLGEQGFSALLSIAPTPLAATWLARAGQRVCVRKQANLTSALSALPVTCLNWPEKLCELFYGMGMSQVGDCLRLPRQGFAKRFGAGRLLEIDRAMGRLPDPRLSYRTPEQFSSEYELAEEIDDSELILNACAVLLQKLEHFLLTRQLAVQRLRFDFFHLQQPSTYLPLGCVQSERSAKHWFELLCIRFEHLRLAAPVIAIQLRAPQGQAMSADTDSFQFKKANKHRRNLSIDFLIERIAARIGSDLVHGVTTVAEHRPQYAWRREFVLDRVPQCQAMPGFWYEREAPELLADIRKTNSLLLRRPLWMMKTPQALAERDGEPVYQGPLIFTDGPERLETGWWDENGIARDYYVAVNPNGVHLWLYRNRGKAGGWFLHGVFG